MEVSLIARGDMATPTLFAGTLDKRHDDAGGLAKYIVSNGPRWLLQSPRKALAWNPAQSDEWIPDRVFEAKAGSFQSRSPSKAFRLELLEYEDLALEKADDGFTRCISYMQRDADSPASLIWKVRFVDATLAAVKISLV